MDSPSVLPLQEESPSVLPLPGEDDKAMENCFRVESEFLPAVGYSNGVNSSRNRILRTIAVHLITFAMRTTENLDAFIPYLAMNYFDRFISRNALPSLHDNLHDDIVLLAVCCLSLAWKLIENSFKFNDLLERANNFQNIKHQEINRENLLKMELQVLEGLQWRMYPITAFCFADYFFKKIPPTRTMNRTIKEIIFQAQGNIEYSGYKPSVIAASALLEAFKRKSIMLSEELRRRLRIEIENRLDYFEIVHCRRGMTVMCDRKKIILVKKASDGISVEELLQEEAVSEDDSVKMCFQLKWVENENEDLNIIPLFLPIISSPYMDPRDPIGWMPRLIQNCWSWLSVLLPGTRE